MIQKSNFRMNIFRFILRLTKAVTKKQDKEAFKHRMIIQYCYLQHMPLLLLYGERAVFLCNISVNYPQQFKL